MKGEGVPHTCRLLSAPVRAVTNMFVHFFPFCLVPLCVSCAVLCSQTDQDRISDFELKLMDIDSEHLGIPKTEYNCTIQVKPAGKHWRTRWRVGGEEINTAVQRRPHNILLRLPPSRVCSIGNVPGLGDLSDS